MDHPLCNPLIISRVIEYLPKESLKDLRLITKTWNLEICSNLRRAKSSRVLEIPEHLEIFKDFTPGLNQLISGRIQLDFKDGDELEGIVLDLFLKGYGSLVREVTLINYSKALLDILLDQTESLDTLIIQISPESVQFLNHFEKCHWRNLKSLTLKGHVLCPPINKFLSIWGHHLTTLRIGVDVPCRQDGLDWGSLKPFEVPKYPYLKELVLPVQFKDPDILRDLLRTFPGLKKLSLRASDRFLAVVYSESPQLEDLTLVIQDSQPASLFVNSRRTLPSNFTDEGITGIPLEICELIRRGDIAPNKGGSLRTGDFIGILKDLKSFTLEKKNWDVCPLTEVSLFCGFSTLRNLTSFQVPCKYMVEMSKYLMKVQA